MTVADFLNSNSLRVALYVAAATCWIVAAVRVRSSDSNAARFWLAGGLLLLVLGVGRELELGSWISHEGRDFAKSHGWYPDRRPLQRRADSALILFGLLALAGVVVWRRRLRVPAIAPGLLVAFFVFIAIRAISYHDVDQALYNHTWHGLRANSVLEGTLMLALAVVPLQLALRAPPTRPSPEQGAQAHSSGP